jgi:hypothetical protein
MRPYRALILVVNVGYSNLYFHGGEGLEIKT